MHTRVMAVGTVMAGAIVAAGHLVDSAAARLPGGGPTPGPDVIVSAMTEIQQHNTVGGITGYSIATTSCNIGDEEAVWLDCTVKLPGCNQHPVIAQNLYRLHEGRFEQIGMSWLKHAFCAVNEFSCGACQITDCNSLGIGCADTYSSFINSLQAGLGPRSEVNASTGEFPYPYLLNWNLTGNAIFKRLQVHVSDLDPALNPGARYFLEAHYVTTDEPAWGNDLNNASHREATVGAFNGAGYALDYADSIRPQSPAIEAWAEADPQVSVATIDVPDDGRLHLAWRVTDLGNGTWHYEYALHNMNSDRSVQRLTVPLTGCVAAGTTGFHDVDYHSGEPYDGMDWPATVAPDSVSWQTDAFDVNPNANALRWSTTYSFRFDADAPPTLQDLQIDLFKPGTPASVTVSAAAPAGPAPPPVIGDCGNGDGTVDIVDLLALLGQWSMAGSPSCDLAPGGGDGTVNISDLLELLAHWGETATCPD